MQCNNPSVQCFLQLFLIKAFMHLKRVILVKLLSATPAEVYKDNLSAMNIYRGIVLVVILLSYNTHLVKLKLSF